MLTKGIRRHKAVIPVCGWTVIICTTSETFKGRSIDSSTMSVGLGEDSENMSGKYL